LAQPTQKRRRSNFVKFLSQESRRKKNIQEDERKKRKGKKVKMMMMIRMMMGMRVNDTTKRIHRYPRYP